jgi:ribosomal protein S13
MLSQTLITNIAAVLRVPAETIKAAIDAKEEITSIKIKDGDKEVDADFSGLQTFTAAELTTRDTNTKESVKGGYHAAGKDIAVKEIKEKLGLDIAGKDIDKVVEAAKAKILEEAKIAPDQKVKELETQLKTLRDTVGTTDAQLKALERERDEAKLDARILASMPARNADISDQDYLLLVKSRIKEEKSADGKEIYKDAQGNILQDKQAVPLGLETVIPELFKSNPAWQPVTGGKPGRGGSNSNPTGGSGGAGGGGGSTPTKFSEAAKEWVEQGKTMNDPGLAQWVGKLMADNKDFEMDTQNVVEAK